MDDELELARVGPILDDQGSLAHRRVAATIPHESTNAYSMQCSLAVYGLEDELQAGMNTQHQLEDVRRQVTKKISSI